MVVHVVAVTSPASLVHVMVSEGRSKSQLNVLKVPEEVYVNSEAYLRHGVPDDPPLPPVTSIPASPPASDVIPATPPLAGRPAAPPPPDPPSALDPAAPPRPAPGDPPPPALPPITAPAPPRPPCAAPATSMPLPPPFGPLTPSPALPLDLPSLAPSLEQPTTE